MSFVAKNISDKPISIKTPNVPEPRVRPVAIKIILKRNTSLTLQQWLISQNCDINLWSFCHQNYRSHFGCFLAGAPAGHVVAVISADDPDDGDNACLSYTIVSGNEDDLFEVVTPSEGRIAVKRSLLSATETWRLFTLHVDVKDGGMPPLSTSTVLNIVVDASLPFAPAQNRFVVINNNRTIVLVLSSLSSATIVLLITVVLLLRRFAADRKQDGDRQTGSGSGGGLGRLGSSPSRLVRTALARYRDRRRRRAKQKRSLAAASRDLAVARDFRRSRDEELSWLSGPPSELSEGETAWSLHPANYSCGDIVLSRDDNTSAIVIVNDNTDHQATSSSFFRV